MSRTLVQVFLIGGTLALNTVTVANNPASGHGGGIYSVGPLTLNTVIVDGNSAGDSCCGGLEISGGVIVSSTISNNSAFSGGGVGNGLNAIIKNSAIISNTATLEGGGIENNGILELTNVTISSNRVNNNLYAGGGGGLFNNNNATLTNVTIANNSAGSRGGGIATGNGIYYPSSPVTTTLKNTIVALNTPSNCEFLYGYPITSLGHNMTDTTGCSFGQPTDFYYIDPMLLPLANNGGPTLTHALTVGSPAIDAGDNSGCPVTDQRGKTRDALCDIGAYEYKVLLIYYFPFVLR